MPPSVGPLKVDRTAIFDKSLVRHLLPRGVVTLELVSVTKNGIVT